MADKHPKGSFKTQIPPEVMDDAVRSVERNATPPADEAEIPVEITPEAGEGASPPGAEDAEQLRAQLELSQQKSRETMERLKEAHERMLRAAADLENYKKRAQREKEELQKFGNEKLLKDLLPVLDNLDRALAAAPAGDPLVAGVTLVRAAFEQVLGRYGVKGFSAMGQPFDPSQHEALLQVPTSEQPPGTVVVEHARGFTLNDRLVRPALVGVSVAPAPDAGNGNNE
ncbi:MAG TPA: nucleotide exchange factor GrpE [Anaeromyxobacteraceae bacterium]|nr:nucleotide exchange factor GrpE [Anaeromyxobacteraceae bacterium]